LAIVSFFFYRQLEPYLRAFMVAPRGVAWDAIPELMEEYIDP
jgi:hypothetical protein